MNAIVFLINVIKLVVTDNMSYNPNEKLKKLQEVINNVGLSNSTRLNDTNPSNTDNESFEDEMYPLVVTIWCFLTILLYLVWKGLYQEKKVNPLKEQKETTDINNVKDESTPI